MTKVADNSTVSAGDQIGYVITVTNSGDEIARYLAFSHPLPNGADLSWSVDAPNSDAGFTVAANALSYGPTDLAAGASIHVHVTSATTKNDCSTINNTPSSNTATDGTATPCPAPITINCGSI